MIAASILDYQQVKGLSEKLKHFVEQALSVIETRPADGRYQIEGDDVFLLVSSPMTEPQAARAAELHHQYLDVQILLEGTEKMGFGLTQCVEAADDDRLEEQDIAFFQHIPGEQFLTMRPGNFVVFFPHELHRPLCAVNDTSEKIKKAVLKVRMTILE
ncbi:YhcH/YjgK/YiaL family protein [Erwinia oleae]|uniref:YhcH/YjgK/YiaL family protein n=1 Tax=Erwinia oleae TaxID=796334 RepID=UPI00068E6DC8|nr:YhcH/YjgK/YiaL family protein [Erwinia oleae]